MGSGLGSGLVLVVGLVLGSGLVLVLGLVLGSGLVLVLVLVLGSLHLVRIEDEVIDQTPGGE